VPDAFFNIFQLVKESHEALSPNAVRQNPPRPARITEQVAVSLQLSNGVRVD
jgi:hypothetical protein